MKDMVKAPKPDVSSKDDSPPAEHTSDMLDELQKQDEKLMQTFLDKDEEIEEIEFGL